MKIGIVGSQGIVGSACKFGFEKNGHEVLCHDIVLNTTLKDVISAEIIFICVPTPSRSDGSCDTSIVFKVVQDITEQFKHAPPWSNLPIIAIKSTVRPGTTDELNSLYLNKFKFAFVPEFLRERCAITDFTENHDVLIVGTTDDVVFDKIKKVHGKYPKEVVQLLPREAEFAKYFNNAYNAMRVVFANSFYELCKRQDVNYTAVKDAVTNINHIPHNYLECNENMRGFGGMCLPKDLRTLANMSEGTNIEFFKNLLDENSKYETTVLPGMRKDR